MYTPINAGTYPTSSQQAHITGYYNISSNTGNETLQVCVQHWNNWWTGSWIGEDCVNLNAASGQGWQSFDFTTPYRTGANQLLIDFRVRGNGTLTFFLDQLCVHFEAIPCSGQIPLAPTARRPGTVAPNPPSIYSTTTVSLVIDSFPNFAAWGTYCPTNNNTYTFYMDPDYPNPESPPTTPRGVLTSNPPDGNVFCGGGGTSCELNSAPIAVTYGESYKWKVTACNGPGSCTNSQVLRFTVLDVPAWWQAVGGDIYGKVIQSKIPMNTTQGNLGFLNPASAYILLD